MFVGEFEHFLDKKARLIIPAKFREILTERYVEKFVLARGLDKCLFLYPVDEWREFEKKIKALPLGEKDARAFKRFLTAGAEECIPDKQGRILIPLNLRTYAGINKEVVIIGVSERIEIWSKENWKDYSLKAENSFAELAQKLVNFGI